MKKIGGVLAICILAINAFGQEGDYSQYFLTMPVTNPGLTGVENFYDLKLSFRQGWSSFGDKNSRFSASTYGFLSSAYRSNMRNNSLRVSDPSTFAEIQNSKNMRKLLRRKHGIGGRINGSSVGPYTSTSVSMNYAYHIPVSKELNWSLGTKVGFDNRKLSFSGYTVRDEINDAFYQQLIKSNQGINNLITADFGTAIYSDKFFVAISGMNIVSKIVGGDNAFSLNQKEQYSVQSGTQFEVSRNLDLSAGGRLDYSETYNLLWSLNSRLRYRKMVSLGLGYQHEVKASLFISFSIDGKYNFNYAYDYFLTNLSNFNINMHEVMIGIALFNKYNLPARMW